MNEAHEISPDTLAAEAARRRTFRRGLLLAALAIAAFAGIRIWWGIVARHRFQSEIDRIHAAGEPAFAADYPSPTTLPDEDNAADYYLRASSSIDKAPHGAVTYGDAVDRPRAIEKYPNAITQIVQANQEVIDIVRQARNADGVEWNLHATPPLINIIHGHLAPIRSLGSHLRLAAICQLHAGDPHEAFEIIRDTLLMADRLEQTDGFQSIIVRLSAASTAKQGLLALEKLTPELTVADPANDDDNSNTMRREDVIALIDQLLDDEPIWRSFDRCMRAERVSGIDSMEILQGSGGVPGFTPLFPSKSVASLVAGPAIRLDTVRIIQRIDAAKDAGLSGKWSNVEANEILDATYAQPNFVDGTAHLFSRLITPSLTRATEMIYRDIAMRRMAATALAIRLYEIDYGARPDALSQLVPDYLKKVPADPFDDNGAPIQYLPDAAPPLLYSINRNQIDEQGRHMLLEKHRVDENSYDLPYFLDGDRPYEAMPDLDETER